MVLGVRDDMGMNAVQYQLAIPYTVAMQDMNLPYHLTLTLPSISAFQ